jgi:hypothetical protein
MLIEYALVRGRWIRLLIMQTDDEMRQGTIEVGIGNKFGRHINRLLLGAAGNSRRTQFQSQLIRPEIALAPQRHAWYMMRVF